METQDSPQVPSGITTMEMTKPTVLPLDGDMWNQNNKMQLMKIRDFMKNRNEYSQNFFTGLKKWSLHCIQQNHSTQEVL